MLRTFAKGNIVFTDADMPYSFDYILQAVSNLKDADVVIGSRYIKKDKNSPYPKYRYFLSRGFAYFANSALSLNLTDTQCGFKAFKNQAAKKIFSLAKINDFCFDVEILYIARQMGFKIVELPVTMRRFRTHTKVKTIKDSLKMFRSVLQIKKHGIK